MWVVGLNWGIRMSIREISYNVRFRVALGVALKVVTTLIEGSFRLLKSIISVYVRF